MPCILSRLKRKLRRETARPHRARFVVPILTDKQGNHAVETLYIPSDANARVKLSYTDEVGRMIGAPEGGEVTSSDPTIGTAELVDNDTAVLVKPLAEEGSFIVSFKDGDLTAELGVTIQKPTAKTATLSVANATFEAKTDDQKEQDAKQADEAKAQDGGTGDSAPKADAQTSDTAPASSSTDSTGKDTSVTGNAPIAQGQENNPAASDHAQPVLSPTKTADPEAPVASGPAPGVAPTTPAPAVKPGSGDADLSAEQGASPAAASVANTAQQPTAAG